MEATAKFNTIIEAPLVPNTKDILRQIEGYVPVNNKFYTHGTLVPVVLGYGFKDVFCNNPRRHLVPHGIPEEFKDISVIYDSPKIDDFCVSSEQQLDWINNQLFKLEEVSKKYVEETQKQTPKTYNLNDIITTNIENPSYRFPEPKEIVGYINPYDFLMIEPQFLMIERQTEPPTLNVYPGAYGSFEIIVYDEKSRQEVTIKTNLQGSSVVNSFIPNVLNSWYIGGVSVRLYYIFEGKICNYDLGQRVMCKDLLPSPEGTIIKLGNDGRDYMDLNNVIDTWGIGMRITGPFCTETTATVTDVQNLDNKIIINKNTGIGKFLDNPKFEKNI